MAFNRVLKNCVSGRDPAMRGFCKCSHIIEYAALSKTPRALADGLILVFQYPVKKSPYGAATGLSTAGAREDAQPQPADRAVGVYGGSAFFANLFFI